jgi:hypothetical protein
MPVVGKAGIIAAALVLTPAAARAEEGWITLAPPQQGFSVEFPAEPTFRDVAEMQGESIALFHDWRTLIEGGVFVIDVVRFSPATRAARTDAELADIAIRGVGAACETGTPREVETANGNAWEVTFRCPEELTMRARFKIEGEWLYQVGAAGVSGFVTRADSVRFLDSFRLVAE